MTYCTYTPGPPLTEFVELFWIYEGYTPSHAKERRLPTGTLELIINLREDTIPVYDRRDPDRCRRLQGGVLSGPHAKHIVIDTASQAPTIGVHFKPGGAAPFLGCPLTELRNTHVSLDTFWRRDAPTLRKQLLEAESHRARFQRLEQVLLAQAQQPLQRHPAVAYALNEFQRDPSASVSDVIAKNGLSHRRFIEVFGNEVGLTPKRFCRIQRFQGALHHIDQEKDVDWTKMALACGYYDQSHFIRDFRAFSGITPTTYRAHRTEHRNHVSLGP